MLSPVLTPPSVTPGAHSRSRPVERGAFLRGRRVVTTDVRAVRRVVRTGRDGRRELLRVVERLVPERPAGLEVPPAAGVGRDAVQDREARGGGGERGVDHPHAVVVRQPGREVADGLRTLEV